MAGFLNSQKKSPKLRSFKDLKKIIKYHFSNDKVKGKASIGPSLLKKIYKLGYLEMEDIILEIDFFNAVPKRSIIHRLWNITDHPLMKYLRNSYMEQIELN